MQHPVHKLVGVLPSDDEVNQGQDDEGMNGQPHQDSQHVVPQLCEHLARVLHGHQLSRDQEDNPKGRVPEPRKDGIKSLVCENTTN